MNEGMKRRCACPYNNRPRYLQQMDASKVTVEQVWLNGIPWRKFGNVSTYIKLFVQKDILCRTSLCLNANRGENRQRYANFTTNVYAWSTPVVN